MGLFIRCRDTLADLGVPLSQTTRILDWGCGDGALVAEGRAAGYDVIGCDFGAAGPHLSVIEPAPYRLPYPDQSIDVVLSSAVLEHVMDYDSSLAELRRVLRSSGAFLHVFPPRFMPIEPHVFVPGATIFRGRAWLLLWASLGVRNQFQAGMSAIARMRVNYAWLREHTNYLSRRQLTRYFERYFGEVRFAEAVFLRQGTSPRGRLVAALCRSLPFLPRAYSGLLGRVVFGRPLDAHNRGVLVQQGETG